LAPSLINPVQPIMVPSQSANGRPKVVIASANAALAEIPQPAKEEVLEECSVFRLEKCECTETALVGVDICFDPRDRFTKVLSPPLSMMESNKQN